MHHNVIFAAVESDNILGRPAYIYQHKITDRYAVDLKLRMTMHRPVGILPAYSNAGPR